jgi:tRNA nucleotidyltransferase (CCA-adding enzyme)
MNSMNDLETTVMKIVHLVEDVYGHAIIVGGAVRDFYMSGEADIFESATDIDLEIFGLPWGDVKCILEALELEYDEVGEQFCVLKIKGLPIDISIPRRENVTGAGHKDFDVIGDPHMSFEEAAKRRDFTMNAMGWNPTTKTFIDPYHGRLAIELGRIFHVSNKFSEDPLRPIRGARFSARFGMILSGPTGELCFIMNESISDLPSERIWMEFRRALLESYKPSTFFWELDLMKWLEGIFPEISALQGVIQDPEWHPEGDVYAHTMHALDYWAQNLKTGNDEDDLIVALSVLCHDFGKVSTTEFVDGKIRARGHEEAGAEPTKNFLHRMRQYELAKQVIPIVENHLYPLHVDQFSARGIRRLATKVPRLDLLAIVSRADVAGRPPIDPANSFAKIDEFERMVSLVDSPVGGPKRLATGDMLIDMGLSPGPEFKVILDHAYELQLDGIISDSEDALEVLHQLLDGPMTAYGHNLED